MNSERGDDLVPIADVATEFEARFLSELLTDSGTAAQAVSSGLPSFSGLGRWSVMVRRTDLAVARAHLVEMRKSRVTDVGNFAECPDCNYSLQGLAQAGRCPECGFDLAAELSRNSATYFDTRRTVPTGLQRRAMPWVLGTGIICVVVGLFSWSYAEAGFEDRAFMPVAVGVVVFVCLVARRIRTRGGPAGESE